VSVPARGEPFDARPEPVEGRALRTCLSNHEPCLRLILRKYILSEALILRQAQDERCTAAFVLRRLAIKPYHGGTRT
jgi:hypothetical protein